MPTDQAKGSKHEEPDFTDEEILQAIASWNDAPAHYRDYPKRKFSELEETGKTPQDRGMKK